VRRERVKRAFGCSFSHVVTWRRVKAAVLVEAPHALAERHRGRRALLALAFWMVMLARSADGERLDEPRWT
jgi:hypothetical protein